MVWWRTGSRTARILRVANPLSFAATATLNALGGAGVIGRGVGQVSDENPTDLTPASYAFSIWGVIYFKLALFCLYSAVPSLRHIGNEDEQFPLLTRRIGWLFVASNVCNAAWICTFVWGTELAIWISCFFIVALEGCLIAIYIRADLWQTRRESVFEFAAVDMAFSTYLGWVTVATILNVTLALTSSGWDGAPLDRAFYPAAMLSVAAVLALLTLATRFDVVYPLVFCWAAVAIVRNDMASRELQSVGLSLVGVVGSLVVVVLVWHVVQACRGGWRGLGLIYPQDPGRRSRRESLNAGLMKQ